jgi:hypothetical protein
MARAVAPPGVIVATPTNSIKEKARLIISGPHGYEETIEGAKVLGNLKILMPEFTKDDA